MKDRENRGREGYRKPKREGWEVGEIGGNYECFTFCNRKRAKERKSRKRVGNRECKVRESEGGGGIFQIWSMLAGYEEKARRFKVWNLSNLVNASRL